MSRTHRSTRTALLAVLALVASLVLAGCGGDDDKEPKAKQTPSAQTTKGGQTLAAVYPLTGLPAPKGLPKHPVVAVKVPNTHEAFPQVGLGRADMVVQELVEGGITRLAVVFDSRLPKLAGPVRSLRATDIGIVKPLHGIVLSSGAAPPTIARLNAAHVNFLSGGAGYFRTGDRVSPYNLMVNPREAARSTGVGRAGAAQSYLPFGPRNAFKGTRPARQVDLRFTGNGTSWHFRYDAARRVYLNTNGHAPKGDQFLADNLLALRVREGDAGYLDPAGNPVPETLFTGRGNALLFHGGQVIAVTWTKKDNKSPISLTTRDGKKFAVPAGRTWLGLVPRIPDGGSVSYGG